MEDPYLNLPPEYQAQVRELERKRQMAMMLQQQALQAPQGTQVIGGRAVKNSPLAGIAQVLSGYLGTKLGSQADTGLAETLGKYQQKGDETIKALSQNPDQQGALAEALTNRDPRVQAWAKALSALTHQQAQTADLQRKTTPQPIPLGANQRLVDPGTYKELVPSLEKPDQNKLPADVQTYEYAVQQGYKGTIEQWKKDLARSGASSTTVSYGAPVVGVDPKTGQQIFFQPPNKAGASPQILSGINPPPKASETPGVEEGKIAAYASQMHSAEQELAKNPIPTNLMGQARVSLANSPARGLAGPEAQQSNQAKQQWAEAFLRFKTGAAAPEAEVARNIATFFPQIGETDPKIVEQKRRMREAALRDVSAAAGRAKGRIPGQEIPAQGGNPAPSRILKYNPATGALE